MEIRKHECGGSFEEADAELAGWRISSVRCDQCGETKLDPLESQLVLAHNRYVDRGEFEGRVTTVGGGSFAVRLPIELARSYELESGNAVQITPLRPGYFAVRVHPAADDIQQREEESERGHRTPEMEEIEPQVYATPLQNSTSQEAHEDITIGVSQ